MNRASAAASVRAPMTGEARMRTRAAEVINAEDESVSPLYAETPPWSSSLVRCVPQTLVAHVMGTGELDVNMSSIKSWGGCSLWVCTHRIYSLFLLHLSISQQ
jgi:hypothetical protein